MNQEGNTILELLVGILLLTIIPNAFLRSSVTKRSLETTAKELSLKIETMSLIAMKSGCSINVIFAPPSEIHFESRPPCSLRAVEQTVKLPKGILLTRSTFRKFEKGYVLTFHDSGTASPGSITIEDKLQSCSTTQSLRGGRTLSCGELKE